VSCDPAPSYLICSLTHSSAFSDVPSKKAITEHVAKLKRDTAGAGTGFPAAASSTPRSTTVIPRKRAGATQKGAGGKRSKKARDDESDDEEVRINHKELKEITNSAAQFTAGAKANKPLELSINTAYANANAKGPVSPVTPRSARKASHAATAAMKTFIDSESSGSGESSDLENVVGPGNIKSESGMTPEQHRRLEILRKTMHRDDDEVSVYDSAEEDIKDDKMEMDGVLAV